MTLQCVETTLLIFNATYWILCDFMPYKDKKIISFYDFRSSEDPVRLEAPIKYLMKQVYNM